MLRMRHAFFYKFQKQNIEVTLSLRGKELYTEYTVKGVLSRKIVSLDNLGIRTFQKRENPHG